MSNGSRDTGAQLAAIRDGQPMGLRSVMALTVRLSVPAVLAQLSSIVMQYIDTAMVGCLGAEASASVGLVSTSTWMLSGLCSAAAAGFAVQVAHALGAGDGKLARTLVRSALGAVMALGFLLGAVGVALSGPLPGWLGGDPSIHPGATHYFRIYASFLPSLQLFVLMGALLRCSGNMRIPSLMSAMMCGLDVVFNYFLIFPTREVEILGLGLIMPGAGWGIAGAALGTGLAQLVAALWMTWYLWNRSQTICPAGIRSGFWPSRRSLHRALRIGLPMGLEHVVICGAQILTTVIVAPLGVFAIAANSFAVTAESLCYMPGYGIADAATTLVGQCYGAGRRELTRRFAWVAVTMGMVVMGLMGVLMYVGAPWIMESMTPVPEVRSLGVMALRIEAFAEPMFAAAIVAYGVFVGVGSTLVPCAMNLFSIWAVRLSLAAALAPTMGLKGVWLAMCIELCFRGVIFLIRLFRGRWLGGLKPGT